MENTKTYVGVALAVLVVFGFFYWDAAGDFLRGTTSTAKTVLFVCDENKSITVTFHLGADRFVDLGLSDGRVLSVPRAISASGARYANAEESFVFWNKGDTAFITEGTSTTYANCVLK